MVTTIILGKFSGSEGIYSINPSHSCTISFITEDSIEGSVTNPLSLSIIAGLLDKYYPAQGLTETSFIPDIIHHERNKAIQGLRVFMKLG